MKAVILAGGFGTRLKDISKDIPKPMVSVVGKPFLEHQIRFLKENGIKDIILTVHHKSEVIKSYFGTGHRWGINLIYADEERPLGTAGAIKNTEKYIDDTFLVFNGDSYSEIDLKEILEFHRNKRGMATIAVKKIDDVSNFGSLTMNSDKIIEFEEKKETGEGNINCGVYLFEPKIFDYIESGKKVSLEKEIFPKLARDEKLWGFQYNGYFMDIGRPETYEKFKKDHLDNLIISPDKSVKEAMIKISDNAIDLLLVADSDYRFLGVLNDKIIKKFLIDEGNIEQKVTDAMIRQPHRIAKIDDDEDSIREILLSGTRHLPILDHENKIHDVRFHHEELKKDTFPSISGKSPLRISFAGGGTDLPQFFEKYGGVVISCTIDKYCHLTVTKRADNKIIINSDLDEEIVLDYNKIAYDGKYDIIKAVAKIVNPRFGFEVYLHNDIPPGRGLGNSASLATLFTKLLGELKGSQYNDEEISEIAFLAETQELGIKGGKQDQYAAVFGGFNWIEFENGNKKIMHPLRLKNDVINELDSKLLLCYVGEPHSSKAQQAELERSINENQETLERLNNLKKTAFEIKECLLSSTPDIEKIGGLLDESWKNKKNTSPEISSPEIDRIYETALKNGAFGGKLLGSGGGGYFLFFYSPKKRNQLVKALNQFGGQVMDFNFESHGIRTWYSN